MKSFTLKIRLQKCFVQPNLQLGDNFVGLIFTRAPLYDTQKKKLPIKM